MILVANVTEVFTTTVSVNDTVSNLNILVYLPSVISRLPVVGDRIVYDRDGVNESYGMFVNYYDENPVVFSTHKHQLLSDAVIANMALDAEQKNEIRSKTTGATI